MKLFAILSYLQNTHFYCLIQTRRLQTTNQIMFRANPVSRAYRPRRCNPPPLLPLSSPHGVVAALQEALCPGAILVWVSNSSCGPLISDRPAQTTLVISDRAPFPSHVLVLTCYQWRRRDMGTRREIMAIMEDLVCCPSAVSLSNSFLAIKSPYITS